MSVLSLYPWVAERFLNVQEEGNGNYVNATCPLGPHGTARVRLWVSTGEVPGLLSLKCWSGCDRLEILRAVGMSYKDCYPAQTDWKAVKQEIVARYHYRDENGVTLYETIRMEPGRGGRDKDFRQRRKVGGAFVWNIDGVRRVLYRLPELMKADPKRVVAVVEGEKDVESLKDIGVLATTNVCGARSEWLDEYSRTLAGRKVVLIEDADDAGRRHANEVCGSLLAGGVTSLRRGKLPAKDTTAYLSALRKDGILKPHELRYWLAQVVSAFPEWVATVATGGSNAQRTRVDEDGPRAGTEDRRSRG